MKVLISKKKLFITVAMSAYISAQEQPLSKSEEIAKGLSIRYQNPADLCSGDDLRLLPPRIDSAFDGVQGGRRRRLQQFVDLVHDEVGKAMKAASSDASAQVRKRNVEVRLVAFRESNRALNIATTLAGGGAVDPGEYRIELVLLAPDSQAELAHAYMDSTPSVRSVLLGNAFSRQSAVRRNIRGQLKKLEAFWASRQESCAARGFK